MLLDKVSPCFCREHFCLGKCPRPPSESMAVTSQSLRHLSHTTTQTTDQRGGVWTVLERWQYLSPVVSSTACFFPMAWNWKWDFKWFFEELLEGSSIWGVSLGGASLRGYKTIKNCMGVCIETILPILSLSWLFSQCDLPLPPQIPLVPCKVSGPIYLAPTPSKVISAVSKYHWWPIRHFLQRIFVVICCLLMSDIIQYFYSFHIIFCASHLLISNKDASFITFFFC